MYYEDLTEEQKKQFIEYAQSKDMFFEGIYDGYAIEYEDIVDGIITTCDEGGVEFEPPSWQSNSQGWYFDRYQSCPFSSRVASGELSFYVDLDEDLHSSSPFVWREDGDDYDFGWCPTEQDVIDTLDATGEWNTDTLLDFDSDDMENIATSEYANYEFDPKDIAEKLTARSKFIEEQWERFVSAIELANNAYPSDEEYEDFIINNEIEIEDTGFFDDDEDY